MINLTKLEIKKTIFIIDQTLTGNIGTDGLSIRILRKLQDECILRKYQELIDMIDNLLLKFEYLDFKDNIQLEEEI